MKLGYIASNMSQNSNKKLWKHGIITTKGKIVIPPGKVLASVIWYTKGIIKGIIMMDYGPKEQTVTGAYCYAALQRHATARDHFED